MGLRVRAHRIGNETLWTYDPSVADLLAEPMDDSQPVPAPIGQPKPPVGYYRQLLDWRDAHLRFALAERPLPPNAVAQGREVVDRVIQHIAAQSADPYAAFYVNGLRDQSIVIVTLCEVHCAPANIY